MLDKGWIAITDFYVRQKNYQKALFYVNKAIGIDNENRLYWKRYATINRALDFLEEAEMGYRKAVEFGDYELDTWLYWIDILQNLGEYDAAIHTLLQASEYFPEEFQLEYRLAGLYFAEGDEAKGKFHLSNGLRVSFENHTILENLFPDVWAREDVQEMINKK